MRFEAALEQILPDLDPATAITTGEIDKELFEKFVMGIDSETALNLGRGRHLSLLKHLTDKAN